MKRLFRIARITHKRTETNMKIAVFVFGCIMLLVGSLLYRLIDLGDMTKYYF